MPRRKAQQQAPITEKAFQAQIVELAELRGFFVYHTHDSRRSQPGFPDLVLIKGTRLVFLEVKSEKGKVSNAQMDWILALQVVSTVHAAVVWPQDWDDIERLLTEAQPAEGGN